MSDTDSKDSGKGKAFFDRADQVAETGNWDFAIELYLEGVQREPENIDHGHQPMRDVSLKRKMQGGKAPGMMEQFKRRPGKDPIKNLLNAEYLLAKEPGSIAYMEQVLKAARALESSGVVNWICDIILESQRQADKPVKRVLVMLAEAFHEIEQFASGAEACQIALKSAPNDPALLEAYKELSTKDTIQKGKYDQEGSFTKGVKDLDKQIELAQSDMLVRSKNVLEQQLERARGEYAESPQVPGKINVLVDALLRFADEPYENEAIDVLTKAHHDTGAYQFKMRIGDIRMRQLKRRFNKLLSDGDRAGAKQQAKRQLVFELEEFAERAANYPTDLALKFELGRRQLVAGQYDEAIASLQQAQREPRRHVAAMNFLGLAFAKKEWFREAAETFQRVLQAEMPEEQTKELRYNLGDCMEKMGDRQQDEQERAGNWKAAQDEFSEVAQIDFNFKDVRTRLENIRKKL